MKIIKKDINVLEEDKDNEILYCPYCIRFDLKFVLTKRPDYDLEDKDLWRYCPNCKKPIEHRKARYHGKLTGFVQPISSKSSIVGLDNKDAKSTWQERAEKEKDEDVKEELRKGNEIREA